MYRRTPRTDVQRLGQVLAGLEYPAAKWQVVMHAEAYGADARTRIQLWSLPSGTYESLDRVLAALGLAAAPPWATAALRTLPAPRPAPREWPTTTTT